MSALRTTLIRALRIPDQTPDAALASSAARGDDTAIRTIITRHGPMVLRVCRQLLHDDHAAEDAFQAVFLVFTRRAPRIARPERLAAWLFGTARHIALKAKRSADRRRRHESHSRPARSDDPPTDLTARELLQALDEEVERLPEVYRLPLLLCYWQNLSQLEATRRLGWSAGSLKGRLERGRKMLAARLTKRGFAPAVLLAASATAVSVPAELLAKTAALTASGAIVPASVAALGATCFGSKAGVFSMTAVVMLAGVGIIGLAGGFGLEANSAFLPSFVNELSAASPEPPPTDSVTVRGRVLDPNGKPAPNAVIYTLKLLPGKNPFPSHENVDVVSRGKTDADGKFQFEIPREKLLVEHNRSWPVMAAADGFGLGWARARVPSDDLNIQLPKEQNINGRVVDSEGRPIPNAEMHIRGLYTGADDRLDAFLNEWKTNWNNSWAFVNKRTFPPKDGVTVSRTNQKGEFKISGVGADQIVTFELRAPGHALTQGYVVNRSGLDPKPYNLVVKTLRPREKRVEGQAPTLYGPNTDIVLERSRTISGVVRDADGKPLVAAQVTTMPSHGVRVSAVTDENGRFTLADLPKRAEYLVRVSHSTGESTRSRDVQLFDTEGLTPIRAEIRIPNP